MIGWLSQIFQRSTPPRHVATTDRIYAVGDIHGRADLLAELIEIIDADARARSDERETRYVFLGDYIDRGPASRQVLSHLAELSRRMTPAPVFLRGNHEAALLSFLENPRRGARWLRFGGVETLASYGIQTTETPDGDALPDLARRFKTALGNHLHFLEDMEFYWQSGDIVFVHAALHPRRSLDSQTEQDLLWGNAAFMRGRVPGNIQVVHGHYDVPTPAVTPHRICVDTGAYYSGRLTAVCLDTEMRFLEAER